MCRCARLEPAGLLTLQYDVLNNFYILHFAFRISQTCCAWRDYSALLNPSRVIVAGSDMCRCARLEPAGLLTLQYGVLNNFYILHFTFDISQIWCAWRDYSALLNPSRVIVAGSDMCRCARLEPAGLLTLQHGVLNNFYILHFTFRN